MLVNTHGHDFTWSWGSAGLMQNLGSLRILSNAVQGMGIIQLTTSVQVLAQSSVQFIGGGGHQGD